MISHYRAMIYASRMKQRILYHIFTEWKYIIRQRRISYRASDISLKNATIYDIINSPINKNLAKECSCMKKKKLLFAILCALGSGTVGFFANQLTEVYGCILFGIGVGLMVYSMINLSK